jgi:23S rRNA pseudouridine2605 synthase
MTEERLQKILSRAGYGSRRSCEELITGGRVLVNGKNPELGSKADPAVDKIEVDHSRIPQAAALIYFAYNKPRFMLCDKIQTGDDRRTVFDMVPGGSDLSVVGRLDFESEGLVLLTNDGEMVNRLTHPRYEHEKEYKVLLASKPEPKQLDAWRRGLILEDGHRTSSAKVEIATALGKGVWLRVIMKEGHKRQIRETAKLLGLFVVRILRVRIGSVMLGPLKSGEWRELTNSELSSLKKRTEKVYSEKKPIGKKWAEKKQIDRQQPEKKPDDKKPTEKKQSDKKWTDKKPTKKTKTENIDTRKRGKK